MKKTFYILLIILLYTPMLVKAEENINTSFDNNKCILTVSGNQIGHEATISLFNDQNELIGFKTGEINNSHYSVDFVLSYNDDKKINVILSNENGTNENFKNDVVIPACNKTVENETYTIFDNNGNLLIFKEESGHTFSLSMFDFVGLTDEKLVELEIPKEMYQAVFEDIVNVTKKYGTLISFYEIEVTDENNHNISDGPFNIKIKMTDEMKKYNTFKLIYVDTEDNYKMEDPITLTVNGNYLEGTVMHLSTYALLGSNTPTNNETNNPQTGDNIMLYVSILGVSIIGLTGAVIYIKKYLIN